MKYFNKVEFSMIHFMKVKTKSSPLMYTFALSYAGFIHYNLYKLFKI
jgi:hypothetical protein